MILEEDWALFKQDSTQKLEAGAVLLSNPFMDDANFKRSVVLLAEHSEENGSMGFILNKPLEIHLSDISLEFLMLPALLHYGGPVQLDTLHFIHRLGEHSIGETMKLNESVYWGGDIDLLREKARAGEVKDKDIRFFVGYSGWSSLQLDKEFEHNSWIVTGITSEQIFDYNPLTMWKDVLKHISDRHAFIANLPENPRLN